MFQGQTLPRVHLSSPPLDKFQRKDQPVKGQVHFANPRLCHFPRTGTPGSEAAWAALGGARDSAFLRWVMMMLLVQDPSSTPTPSSQRGGPRACGFSASPLGGSQVLQGRAATAPGGRLEGRLACVWSCEAPPLPAEPESLPLAPSPAGLFMPQFQQIQATQRGRERERAALHRGQAAGGQPCAWRALLSLGLWAPSLQR